MRFPPLPHSIDRSGRATITLSLSGQPAVKGQTGMGLSFTDAAVKSLEADAIVTSIFADSPLPTIAAELDLATGGQISKLIETKEITGKKGEVTLLLAPPGLKTAVLAVVGLGKPDALDQGTVLRSFSAAAKQLSSKPRAKVALAADPRFSEPFAEAAVTGMLLGSVGSDLYRTKKGRFPFGELVVSGIAPAVATRGEVLANAMNLARHLVNEPPSEIYPESFAAAAVKVAEQSGLAIEVWDQARLEAERCGSLLAVARGSSKPARLVILKYMGGPSGQAPLALVGKGVTFDSGGLSIKPTDGMKTMKCDMAGAATVVATLQAIAALKLPINVIGLCGLVENMLSGDSYKLGDVLTARSGKTIEVLNTDAEGRLVLADVLDVALQHDPARIIDLATLTGACMVALGNDVAGLMTNDQALCDLVRSSADTVGEQVWQLPMFPEYGEQIRSDIADIKNVGDGRWGGAITAAKFLEEFVNGKPWLHIDIAGPSYFDSPKPWLDAGGSGCLVRTLVEVVRRYSSGAV